MDSATALQALDAALGAYNLGQGYWPTRSVADRIAYVEKFLARMRIVRNEVVNLLMWEIGKQEKTRKRNSIAPAII